MVEGKMSEKDLERLVKACANRRRIAILRLLKAKKEVSVGDIATEIKLSFNATSKHLLILASAGIVDREQRSLQMFYHLSTVLTPTVRTLISIL